jgi:arsenate reductase-like glutaredoxin family protein
VLLGMLGGLFVNTLLSQGQYQIQELQNQSIALADEHEILAQNVSRMESPEVLKNKAIEIGMIPSAGSAFIDLRDGRLMGAGVDPILNEPDPNVVTPVSTP